MTKDLAICVHGTMDISKDKYATTMEFIKKVADNLKKNLQKAKM